MEIGVELARRPESRAKNSASKQGKVLSHAHKIRLFAAMNAGWKERFKARRAAYRRTGRFPKATKSDPWIPEEEKLLSKYPTPDLARIIRRTPRAIVWRRSILGIRSLPSPTRQTWKESETKILGTDTDRVIAKRLERSVFSVTKKRQALGIRRLSPTH
jgi:hypothetical protein